MPTDTFLAATGKQYDNMRGRFRAKYTEDNKLVRPGREIPFSKEAYRAWARHLVTCGLRCSYCLRALRIDEMEPDHDIPVKKRGGSLALDNIVPSCRLCNVRKGDLTGEEFKALLKGLATFPEKARQYIFQKLAQRPVFRPQRDESGKPKAPRKTFSKPRPAPATPPTLFEEKW